MPANGSQKYKRILLKLSGESLMGDKDYGIDDKMRNGYAEEIKSGTRTGVHMAEVVQCGKL